MVEGWIRTRMMGGICRVQVQVGETSVHIPYKMLVYSSVSRDDCSVRKYSTSTSRVFFNNIPVGLYPAGYLIIPKK